MPSFRRRFAAPLASVAALVALPLLISACGGSDDEASKLALSVNGSGKSASFGLPSEADGGLTEVTLTNNGNSPHQVQFVLLEDGHTSQDALDIIESEQPQEIPEWIRAEGGVGTVAPGESKTATIDLPEGNYVLTDDADGPTAQPADLPVGGGSEGDLPDTDVSVTAAETDDPNGDEYEWQVDGLKAGDNEITFKSEGKEALHHLIAIPIVGDATLDEVKKDFESNREPTTIDFENAQDTAILDGGKDLVTHLNLKEGRYVFVCFLSDRDEPHKPHFNEGLFTEETIPAS